MKRFTMENPNLKKMITGGSPMTQKTTIWIIASPSFLKSHIFHISHIYSLNIPYLYAICHISLLIHHPPGCKSSTTPSRCVRPSWEPSSLGTSSKDHHRIPAWNTTLGPWVRCLNPVYIYTLYIYLYIYIFMLYIYIYIYIYNTQLIHVYLYMNICV